MSEANGQPDTMDVLTALSEVIAARRQADPDSSYVARLLEGGPELIARKLGEEAVETVVAALSEPSDQLVNETADLWFHSMVLLAAQGRSVDDVLAELARRFGVSGLEEKQARRGTHDEE